MSDSGYEDEDFDESSSDEDDEPGSDISDEDSERVRRALEELATLTEGDSERVILELLKAVESGDLPLSSLLGYTDDDLYNIYEKAYNLYKGGRPKNVVPICEALLSLNPGLPAAQLLLAGSLMDLRQYSRALDLIDDVLAVDSEDLEAHLKRGHILYRLGRLEESAETLERLGELNPEGDSEEAIEGEKILRHVRELLEAQTE